MDDFFKVLGCIALVIAVIVFLPFISFWLHYFGGWLAKLVIGAKLATALNILFNTTYFTAEMIPMMAGALGWIGAFFKGTVKVKDTTESWFN